MSSTTGPPLPDPPGFTPPGAGKFTSLRVFCKKLPSLPNGKKLDDALFSEQVKQVFFNLDEVLKSCGADSTNLPKYASICGRSKIGRSSMKCMLRGSGQHARPGAWCWSQTSTAKSSWSWRRSRSTRDPGAMLRFTMLRSRP